MNIYELFRPFLFSLPPEVAHTLTLSALQAYRYLPSTKQVQHTINVGGLNVPNRIGLAAGFDKDGVAIRGLSKLNFGFLEFGAVTPRAQIGNPRPRVFRLPQDRALINRLGFNNRGVDTLMRRIVKVRSKSTIPIGVNIGKNFDTPLEHALDDYEYCFNRANTVVDFVTVNVSSPNTPGLRDLHSVEHLSLILTRLAQIRDVDCRPGRCRTLILVKVSPDLAEGELESVCAVIKSVGIDGLVATNTTTSRPDAIGTQQSGGLSGRPLFPKALHSVRQARRFLGEEFLIIGCGGIWDQDSAQQMRDAGADLLQLYTGLVYLGPSCIKQLSKVS